MKDHRINFLISALHKGLVHTTDEVILWMKEKNNEVVSSITQIPLSELKSWKEEEGRIKHISGKFFSIDGIRITTNYGLISSWDQPIINQPEIGFLGCIVKNINGILHFLMQAKIEPGNLNVVQLSPTLQATRSNYMRVHNGKSPLYLEYFTGEKNVNILIDQLQSEQGSRFLQKRNRNIIVQVPDDENVPAYNNFIWVTLGQIKELLYYPNIVNMDTRTVISCIKYGSYDENSLKLLSAVNNSLVIDTKIKASYLYSVLSTDNHLHELNDILKWITALKFKYELNIEKIPIHDINNWIYDGNTIFQKDNKYFSVIGVNVQIGNREVTTWDQPMVKSSQEGIIGFLVKNINGIYHFLVQAKLEAGNFDIIELAPTVQCLTGNYRTGHNEYSVPYINNFLNAPKSTVWYSTYQSEEGGRFFKEQNLNIIVEVGDEFPVEVESNFCWMTLNQLLSFISYNNFINIAARSLLSAVKFN